jgi:hypothetical protein
MCIMILVWSANLGNCLYFLLAACMSYVTNCFRGDVKAAHFKVRIVLFHVCTDSARLFVQFVVYIFYAVFIIGR